WLLLAALVADTLQIRLLLNDKLDNEDDVLSIVNIFRLAGIVQLFVPVFVTFIVHSDHHTTHQSSTWLINISVCHKSQ
ncbi:hypothetical protein HON49_02665, partial [archaeon]|nr:hypothetical protein [archaeon]